MSTTEKVYTFTAAADAAQAIEKKGGGLWQNLAGYVVSLLDGLPESVTLEGLRGYIADTVKDAEHAYMKEHPKATKLSNIVAYRSAKSVVLKAVEMEVPLLTAEGKLRGKSDVEKAIKDGKQEKTPMEKFRLVHASLASIADTLLTEMELLEAMKMLGDTVAKLDDFRKQVSKKAA